MLQLLELAVVFRQTEIFPGTGDMEATGTSRVRVPELAGVTASVVNPIPPMVNGVLKGWRVPEMPPSLYSVLQLISPHALIVIESLPQVAPWPSCSIRK
jgi:hypothetical protein